MRQQLPHSSGCITPGVDECCIDGVVISTSHCHPSSGNPTYYINMNQLYADLNDSGSQHDYEDRTLGPWRTTINRRPQHSYRTRSIHVDRLPPVTKFDQKAYN